MRKRKIKISLLIVSGIVYRLHIIVAESILLYLVTGKLEIAIKASVLLNFVSLLLYYNYHYWFAKYFRLGKNGN